MRPCIPLMNWSAHGSNTELGPGGIHHGLVAAWSLTGTANVDGGGGMNADGIAQSGVEGDGGKNQSLGNVSARESAGTNQSSGPSSDDFPGTIQSSIPSRSDDLGWTTIRGSARIRAHSEGSAGTNWFSESNSI